MFFMVKNQKNRTGKPGGWYFLYLLPLSPNGLSSLKAPEAIIPMIGAALSNRGLQLFERQIPQKVSSDAFSHGLNIDFFAAGNTRRDKVRKINSFFARTYQGRASGKPADPRTAVFAQTRYQAFRCFSADNRVVQYPHAPPLYGFGNNAEFLAKRLVAIAISALRKTADRLRKSTRSKMSSQKHTLGIYAQCRAKSIGQKIR